MRNALRQLLNNLSSIVLALLLAVAVWIAATLQADPFAVREYAAIPVTFLNQPENTVLFEGDAARVNVEARAQQSILAELKASDFVATMDLSDIEMGVSASVPISVTCNLEAVRIEAYDPGQETVHLEELGTMTMPIGIELEGQVATGYYSSQLLVDPEEVTLSGPLPYLGNVASVMGLVNVDGAREDILETVSVTPRNSDGRLVAGVEWDPDQVDVSLRVRRRVGYKPDVEVVPDVRGDPAPGYRRGSVSVEPSTVTLAGPSQVLNDLPGFVETLPISITGATAVLTERTPLTIPTNVVVVGIDFVTVTVDILPILSSRTMTSVVEIRNLAQGRQATLSPPEVDVILEGPDALVTELLSEDIQVFVNLFDLQLGVHRVEPVVLAPEGLSVVSVIPETIEVGIIIQPTPSPTSTLPVETPEP
jgi:YbbR domain-containing protein